MAWTDRIRQAAYTSPSGVRISFDYENVSKAVDKKTTGFEFPDADGTFIQDLGHTGRRYPFQIFFWGDNYDIAANAFEAILLERGTGRLEHPIYGTVDVVPFGTITRRDDLKTAANQAIMEVTVWETTNIIYPTGQAVPAAALLAAVDEYNAAFSEEFAAITDLDSAVEQASFKNTYQGLLDSVSGGLRVIADTQENVSKQFNAIVDSINSGIDILIGQPLNLAFQTTILIQAPARALTSITARLDAYSNLLNIIITGDDAITVPGNDSRNSNNFHTRDLYASTYITGYIVSSVNNQFLIKSDAIAAAEIILDQFENVTNWRDDNFESLLEIDTGKSYQQLQEAVALAAGFLVEISFSLQQERHIILERSRTIIDLVAELYGTVDDQLDFFINTNNLSGSEILELPRGRDVVYYVGAEHA